MIWIVVFLDNNRSPVFTYSGFTYVAQSVSVLKQGCAQRTGANPGRFILDSHYSFIFKFKFL